MTRRAIPMIETQRGMGTMCLFESAILVDVDVENLESGLIWGSASAMMLEW